ncbi:MAG: ABC transporter substrate-binding protein [Pyrobaculum sp.]|uniref:ABC transporter substrate-binding protein n=1 Tax=Pyrobaculum sp. TaxID=2004705 RepID=UPI00316EDDF3
MQLSKEFLVASAAFALSIIALAIAVQALGQLSSSLISLKADVTDKLNILEKKVGELQQQLSTSTSELRGSLQSEISGVNKTLSELRQEVTLLRRVASMPSGQVSVKYASFYLAYEGGAYLLKDSMGRRVLLLPRGIEAPLASYLEAKYRPDLVVIYPVERAVFMAATQVAMVYRLYNETGDPRFLRSIAGIMWGRDYEWYLPEVKAMLQNGTIKDVGSAYSPNYEAILALKPDVVFVYFSPGPYGTEAVIQRLQQLGVPYVVVNEFNERNPLGRFEWVKAVAAFFNATDKAVAVFNKVEARWDQLASLAADLDRPRVAWFFIYQGILYPAGPTVRELIRLAGGRYAYANYSRVDLEVVLKHRNDVDVLIWSGYGVSKIEDIVKIEPRLKELRPVVAGRVYAYSPAFYQLSNAYPERVLEELVSIIHPEISPPGRLTLFIQLQ